MEASCLKQRSGAHKYGKRSYYPHIQPIQSKMAATLFFLALTSLAIPALDAALAQEGSMRTESDLREDIFMGYDRLVRPVKKASTAVPLSVSISPLALINMDTDSQVIKIDSWIVMKWQDEYLKWNPEDYDNITELRVVPTTIWKPDLALYTATPDSSLFPIVQTQAVVVHTGKVLWVPPFTINSRCPIHRSNTFKDLITCNVRFGSWTNSERQLDIQLATEKVDLTNFADFNSDWKLIKVVSNRESKHYDCCVEAYPLLNFNFTFKRRSYSVHPGVSLTRLTEDLIK